MPRGWEQQAGSGIEKGIPCMVVDGVPEVSASSRLDLCWWWLWFIPHGSSGGPNSKSCTCRSLLYMLENVSVLGFWFFFCPFVWTTTDCSLSLLVSLLSSEVLYLTFVTECVVMTLRQRVIRNKFSGVDGLVHIPSALELCGGMCFSDSIWPVLCFVPPIWLLCHCRWVLTLLCEKFLHSPKNYYHQSHLGIFILYNARGIQNVCSTLLASMHSSRCFSFWTFIGSCSLRFFFFRAQWWIVLNVFCEAHSLCKPKLSGMGKRMLSTCHTASPIVTSELPPVLLSL